MASCRHLFSLAVVITLNSCNGFGPIYANLRQEVDNLASKMKDRFEGFATVMEMFDMKLDSLNASLSTDSKQINISLEKMKSKLKQELDHTRLALYGMGNQTAKQLDDIKGEIKTMQKDTTKVKEQLVKGQGDSRKILKAIDGLKEDYKDFKMKTNSLWTMQANLSVITRTMEENKKKISKEITAVKRDIRKVVSEEMLTVQTALASLLNDMSTVKNSVKNIGFTTDCPSDWRRFENSCYLKVLEETSWKRAKFMCNQLGAFLTEMYSEEEITFVAGLTGNDTAGAWTGATIGRKGVWYWSESRSEVDLELFKGDYPTGRSRAYCGRFMPKDGSLDDVNCGRKNQFVCRKFSLKF